MSRSVLKPLLLAGLVAAGGALFAVLLSGSFGAAVTCAVTGLLIAALMVDRAVEGTFSPDAPPPPPSAPTPPAPGTGETDALIAALPDPALVLSAGRIERANDAARTLLGAHVLGQDVRLAIRHPAVTQHLAGGAEKGAARFGAVGLGAPDRSWELAIAPLSPTRQLVLMTDRSAHQAAERMRVDFVANASHELRTPLAAILGFIETLKDRDAGEDAATRERFLTIMEGEARRMQRLVEDLMSLSRIEADKFRTPDRIIDLVPLVREAADVLRHDGSGAAIDIRIETDRDAVPVRGDHAQLGQLVHNLIGNAVKYRRPGTPVRVGLAAEEGTIRICVADEGEGIAPEHLPRLTERFYRVDPGRSRALGGTGLGLAIVKHIVERHRGRLHIDSVVGRGTLVTVTLPAIDAD